MLDFRYHALSLAAVLLALTVGVLIGVAIGDSNLVSSAKNGIVRDLNADVSGADARASNLHEQLEREQALTADLYPLAVHGLLSGRRVGLVFLGDADEDTDQFAREAVSEAGGRLTAVVAVREPLELAGLAQAATGTRYAALPSDPGLLSAFGARVGIQLVGGGRLLGRIQTRLLSSFDGQFGNLEGLVVARLDPPGLTSVQARQAQAFESGLMQGFAASGAIAVGVELTSTSPSEVSWYKSRSMPSVDDLNTVAGRTALAFALAGARGAWGVKPSADGLLPGSPAYREQAPPSRAPVRHRR
jgi:Copper transport outer membrane protein, MctB